MTHKGMSSIVLAALATVTLVASRAPAQEKPVEVPKVEGNIADRTIDDLVKSLSTDSTERRIAEMELPRRGKAAIPGLVLCLRASENSDEARLASVHCLGKIKDPSAAPALVEVYKNPGAPLKLRGEAALALGDIEAASAIPDLIEGLANPMFKVSETARTALTEIGQPAVDPVVAAFAREMAVPEPRAKAKDQEKEAYLARDGMVCRCILVLGKIGGPKARAAICDALKTQKGSRAIAIRHHAAIALGFLRADEKDKDYRNAVEPLIKAFEVERDFSVGNTIQRSLVFLTDQTDLGNQPYRWRAWWNVNGDRFLGADEREHANIELPKGGLKPGDSLEEPKSPSTDPPK
jgi:HEAT repeat protein